MFWTVYSALLLLFITTLNISNRKILSAFSPTNTRLIQLFVLLGICVTIGLHYTHAEGLKNSNMSDSKPITYTTNIPDSKPITYATNAPDVNQSPVEANTPAPPALTVQELSILGHSGTNNPKPNAIYYEPGTYMYNGTGYEPTYAQIMLSASSEMQPVPITSAPYLLGGFCNYFKASPMETEQKCKQLSPEICASTDCCVLLSGRKCVAGDEHGAKYKTNYSDFLLGNVDYYYYKGKCFGNCP